MSPYDDNDMRAPTPSAGSADDFDGYSYTHGRNNGAADAANELEVSLLGATHGKSKVVRKRPAGDDTDDDSSDPDVPIAMRHGNKKRKLAQGLVPGSTESRTHTIPESMAAMTGTIPLKGFASKGKGTSIQREDSYDSVSATPRRRKKPGKRGILPPHTQEALGLGSVSASVSRDITPSASRAPSPTLTNVSATIYELDEAIPALKKARRIDDAGMWKRVKSLEETQKKVWTSIARKDVVKVCRYDVHRLVY